MLWGVCFCVVAAALELPLDSYMQEILSHEETQGRVERWQASHLQGGKTQTLSAGTVWLGTNPVSRVCLLICDTGMTIIALCQSWADTQRVPGTGWGSRQVLSPASFQPQPGLSHVAYSGGQNSWERTSIYTPEDTWLHFLWTQETKTFLLVIFSGNYLILLVSADWIKCMFLTGPAQKTQWLPFI